MLQRLAAIVQQESGTDSAEQCAQDWVLLLARQMEQQFARTVFAVPVGELNMQRVFAAEKTMKNFFYGNKHIRALKACYDKAADGKDSSKPRRASGKKSSAASGT